MRESSDTNNKNIQTKISKKTLLAIVCIVSLSVVAVISITPLKTITGLEKQEIPCRLAMHIEKEPRVDHPAYKSNQSLNNVESERVTQRKIVSSRADEEIETNEIERTKTTENITNRDLKIFVLLDGLGALKKLMTPKAIWLCP